MSYDRHGNKFAPEWLSEVRYEANDNIYRLTLDVHSVSAEQDGDKLRLIVRQADGNGTPVIIDLEHFGPDYTTSMPAVLRHALDTRKVVR